MKINKNLILHLVIVAFFFSSDSFCDDPLRFMKDFQDNYQFRLEAIKYIKNNTSSAQDSKKQTLNIELNPNNGLTVRDNFNYMNLIEKAAKRHHLDPALIKAIIKVESNFDPYAISSKNAKGLMQLHPDTAQFLNLDKRDIFKLWNNIDTGCRYFSSLLREFKSLELALIAYNAGPEVIRRNYRIPNESKNYVFKVIRYYEVYKKLNVF